MRNRMLGLAGVSGGILLACSADMAAGEWSGLPESAWPAVTQEAVLARCKESAPERLLPMMRPRLFFTEEQWRAFPERYAKARGRERELFERMMTRARHIAEQPAPRYRTPEEMASPTLTLYAAEEELWQRPVGDNLVILSFALALEREPAIEAKLRETVLQACGYAFWGRKPRNRDLSFGHIARGIAIAYDWHPGLWSTEEKELIRLTIRARAEEAKEGLYGGVYWAKRYRDNHNHVPVAGLGLCGLAFLGEIPEAAEWTIAALTNFENVARYSFADGSSPEGVPYGSYSLTFILQYIEGTRRFLGTDALYQAPFFRHALSDRLHSSTPGFRGVLPWGDAVARDYCGPQHILYRLAAEYRSEEGQFLGNHIPFPPQGDSDVLAWTALWYDPSLAERAPAELDYHADVSDLVMTRNGWSQGDYLLCLKAGLNNRNHGHLDAGALAFILGDDWLLTTPGYGKGGGDPDFWNRSGPRWHFFSNAAESHSTLLVDGKNQRFGEDARGTIDEFVSGDNWCWTGVDLRKAYDNVSKVRRELLHRRGEYALVFDEVIAGQPVKAEWLAQVPVNAEADGARLVARGEAGELELRAIAPAGARFSERKPTSAHMDIPANRLKTMSLAAEGAALRFAVAMIPRGSEASQAVRNLTVQQETYGSLLTVEGEGWKDRVILAAGHLPLRLTPEAVSPGDDLPLENALAIQSRVAAVRYAGPDVESLLMSGARRFSYGRLHLDLAASTNLILQRIDEGLWMLDAGDELQLTEIGTGWHIVSSDGNAEFSSWPATLPKGRYALIQGTRELGSIVWARSSRPEAPENIEPQVRSSPSLPAAPARARIFMEAEQFSTRRGDPVETVRKPGASGGLAVRGFGGGVPEQALAWKFRVQEAGEYVLRLRYCSAWPCRFAVLLDGFAPGKPALNVAVPATGGWSVAESNWRAQILTDSAGNPLRFALTAGEHEIRMVRAVSPINLDSLEFVGSAPE